ncbi:MAG: sigma-70 family RNA polymerase sigma factor [Chloroflexi bacterium]|nr:sigma-70 family RNA polymerase sigma factor [Chloroflexota bacterium]
MAFRAAYLIVRDEDDAADVAQDAFVRAYRSLGTFDAGRPFRPWLLRIVTNVALNSTRSSKRRSAATERLARDSERGEHEPPDAALEAAEQSERVWTAVADLPGDDQRLIYLRYFLETSEVEAAESIGRPVGTVKSRLHRALKRLRRVIEDGYPDLLPLATQLLREERHESTANT